MLEKTFNEIFNNREIKIIYMDSNCTENGDIKDEIILVENGQSFIYEGLRFFDETYKGKLIN